MGDHLRTEPDDRLGKDGGLRRRARILGLSSALLATALAAVTLAAPAGAAQASGGNGRPSPAAASAAEWPGTPSGELAATCHYRVRKAGGIRIYRQRAVGATWGSLRNGATFYSTCSNGTGQVYTDCPGILFSFQWKAVKVRGGHTGYVKTKCLVRI